jgi:hypothetical protein
MAKAYDDGLCRNCPLPSCDDGHPRCFYRIWCKEQSRENNAKRSAEQNRACYKRYYAANRESEIARVAAYDAANVERRRERQRAYYHRQVSGNTATGDATGREK